MTISNEAAAGMETVELEPLREDKKRIFKDILGYFETHQRGYIKVPTGWGKTFLAKHIMKNTTRTERLYFPDFEEQSSPEPDLLRQEKREASFSQ